MTYSNQSCADLCRSSEQTNDETVQNSNSSAQQDVLILSMFDQMNLPKFPKETPTVSMVNTSLKELKRYLADFDQVVKERTTANMLSLRARGCYEHIQASIDKDIARLVVNLSVNASGETVTECRKCLELETELVKKKDFVDKETYDKLCKCFTTLEKHCITLEADSQLKSRIFQQENMVLNQICSEFSQLFELSELKAQSQAKDTVHLAFRQHTCFIRNLEGVDLLTGSRGDNLYTLSLGNMMASSPICLLSKASKTKSWLWHRRLSHLNFGSINHLARHGLVRGLPKLKFEKDHLCSACALGKSSKKPHKPKSEDTNQEKLYLLHMDLCGPMRVASVNGKKYILVIVDDYSRFTWVKCLRSKDEAPAFIINFLKMIQVRLKETVRRIRTDNGTEFVNQTLREYYEKVGISHETSVARR
ncbi:retrovirus-related pol polyprotein from transposon TNT 1-94 [Tanacetum coccineum]